MGLQVDSSSTTQHSPFKFTSLGFTRSSVQQPFVHHVRQRLLDGLPKLPEPRLLFPTPDTVSAECLEFLSVARCLFSSKLVTEALTCITRFVNVLVDGDVVCVRGSEIETTTVNLGGDVVQCMQALKESRPERSSELENRLVGLLEAFSGFRSYCDGLEGAQYPFRRAERQTVDALVSLYPDEAESADRSTPTASRLVAALPNNNNSVETVQIGFHRMPRLFNGLWQLSSTAWGSGTAEAQESALLDLVNAGLTAADMADHYGDAELIYGDFRARLSPEVRSQVYAATKWCVFGPLDTPVTYELVLEAVKERSRRLSGRIELLQFHWYDYEVKDYLRILMHLSQVADDHPETLSAIGLCNFDSKHTEEVCAYLLETIGKVGIVSNQVQFSLFDSRPLHHMVAVCERYRLKLLTYGSFSGGFLSERWLAQDKPDLYSSTAQLTPSARKYYDILSVWGSWQEFQELLNVLSRIGKKYGVSLTNIVTRWILQQRSVGAVIVGTRLGVSSHGSENLAVFKFLLDEDDMALINEHALGKDMEKSKAMLAKLGDCGNEYRAMH